MIGKTLGGGGGKNHKKTSRRKVTKLILGVGTKQSPQAGRMLMGGKKVEIPNEPEQPADGCTM